MSDQSGTIPFYDDPFTKVFDDFVQWYTLTDENKTDNEGQLTLPAKVKRSINSFVRNLEFSAGLGVGLGQECEILDLGASLSANYDIFAVQYCDDTWNWGQCVAMSISVSATQAFEFGAGLDSFRKNGREVKSSGWLLFNNTKESWTIFSYANYALFLGGNVYLGFDLNTFLYEMTEIWE